MVYTYNNTYEYGQYFNHNYTDIDLKWTFIFSIWDIFSNSFSNYENTSFVWALC